MIKALFIFFILFVNQTCFAILPVNDLNLQDAMRYGLVRSNTVDFSDTEFLAPWTVSESTLANPYRFKETTVIYTPYMLASLQARHLTIAKQPFSLADIKKFIQDYDGITVIGAVVNTPLLMKAEDFHVVLEQDKITLLPYASEFLKSGYLDENKKESKNSLDKTAYLEELRARDQALKMQIAAVETGALKPEDVDTNVNVKIKNPVSTKIARIDLQYYFDNSKFNPNQPYRILISDTYCGTRTFNVNTARLK